MTGKNKGASVLAKLKNASKSTGIDTPALLRRYAQERFLYRLSVSSFAEDFCLKGGVLLSAYNDGNLLRPTHDIDFNGFEIGSTMEKLKTVVADIASIPDIDDGVVFDLATLRVEKDKVGRIPGGKVSVTSNIGTAKVEVRVDVGFGNVITPGARPMTLPSLLSNDAPQPRVLTYPLETVIAEKVHAMVQFGLANTRLKDYYDIWLLSRLQGFDGETLSSAFRATFEGQGRAIPQMPFDGLSDAFAEDHDRNWDAFLARLNQKGLVALDTVITEISAFVGPIIDASRQGLTMTEEWQPGRGWQAPGLSDAPAGPRP